MVDIALNVKNISKVYNNGFQAVKNVSFKVNKGDFFALLGPNGAGKSTTLGMISSLVNISKGDIEIFGSSVAKNSVNAKKNLGFMSQEINLSIFETPIQILLTQAGYFGISRKKALSYAIQLLKDINLYDKKDIQVRFLSGGMKRRLMVARALIHKPKLLILDEPTAGVDVELRQSLWRLIKKFNEEQGLTIILTTHYLDEAENMCNKIALIHHGEVFLNTEMKDLLRNLDFATYIIDFKNSCDKKSLDELFKNISYQITSSTTVEVTIKKEFSITDLFKKIISKNLEVVDFRTKSTKLEQMFIDIAQNKS